MTVSFRLRNDPPAAALRIPVLALLLVAMAGAGTACAPSESARGPEEDDRSAPRATPASSSTPAGPSLVSPGDDVRTIQLYGGADERSLPILRLDGEESIRLEFDLMADRGRPLSIYFDHANRTWERDLSPSQYLDSFQNDDLLSYEPSIGTEVSYVHYSYRFPNDDIQFRVSGNYILRVTEQGQPDEVLFERPFFIAEDVGGLDVSGNGIVVSGQRQPSIQPIARYLPPAEIRGAPFGYTACFLRNGRLGEARCEDRPRLTDPPALRFELPRRRAFAPGAADYFLDLSSLQVGGSIERVDRSTSPFAVLLEPDYAEFAGSSVGPPLNGQTVVRGSRAERDPALTSEYVRTTFAFVPPNERPVRGPLTVGGSFSGMRADPTLQLSFRADRGRYEGEVLLKQGQYEYFYHSTDPNLQRVLRQHLPRATTTVTTLLYYDDARLNTDRLLVTQSFTR